MIGWRLRIGLIVPSPNTVMEPEFYQHVPTGVSVHTSRMQLTEVSSEELLEMGQEVERCAELLKTANVDILVFGCTSGSFLQGKGYDQELQDKMEETSGVPAVTTSQAVVEALRAKDLNDIVVATPYPDEINEREVKYLEDYGFVVRDISGLRISKGFDIGERQPTEAYNLGLKLAKQEPNVDGVFISCTNFRTFEIIKILSEDIGKPVITSNQASLWMALRKVGISNRLWGLEC